MIRFAVLLLLSANLYAAESAVEIDTASQVYQAAGVREEVRASLRSMPGKMRQMFAGDQSANLSDAQLAAVESAAARGFRIDVFEAPALTALAANLDATTVKKSLAFLGTGLGRRMVEADIALANLDEAAIDKVTRGELAAPSTPEREALFVKLERDARSTDSAVQIYLSIARALAIGTAIGGGMDPIAADERARSNADAAAREDLAQRMREPLRRYMAYGYRELSNADLRGLLAFLDSRAGERYVNAYMAAMSAGFDAMGRRCGEQIGESWRELAQARRAAPVSSTPAETPSP
jgi:hypothetical protein